MIISRKYEWLGILYENDPMSKKLIDKSFENGGVDSKTKQSLLEYNTGNIPAYMDLGCGIPGPVYKDIMQGFEKLDALQAYDNGLTFKDVDSIEYETRRKGTAIQMRFVISLNDLPYRIVGLAAIENKDGKMEINEGWEMYSPYFG